MWEFVGFGFVDRLITVKHLYRTESAEHSGCSAACVRQLASTAECGRQKP